MGIDVLPVIILASGQLNESDHMNTNNRRDRVIKGCYKYGEIGPMDDGFQYFWIKDRGALSAFDLRAIADELDRRNEEWKKQIDADLRDHCSTPSPFAS